MKNIYYSFVFILFLSQPCLCQKKTTQVDKKFVKKDYVIIIPPVYLKFQQKYIDSLLAVKSNFLAIDSDTGFVADSVLQYAVEFGWEVFLIKGRMLPSEAEFHFYGILKNNELKVFDFFSIEVEIETILVKYKANPNKIIVYGKQWDTSGLDNRSIPSKRLQILLQYP